MYVYVKGIVLCIVKSLKSAAQHHRESL